MTKIKICGLKRPEDIRAVNEAQPDFAGFVIEVSKSRRNVSVEQVRELAKGLSEQIQAVGVFVNAPLDLVAGLLNDGTLALAQLHGSEDEAYIRQLRQMIDKPLLQAFSIRTEADIERALQSSADYLLLDQGGGGTIAYILANYGMNVIDSGVAVLNMHAPWEIISKVDLYEALHGYVAFLKEA